jgi:twitching motility protein PilT
MHTSSASATINRILDMFPSQDQTQVRASLTQSIRAIACQVLIPSLTGKGRVLALEIMKVTPAIRSAMRTEEGANQINMYIHQSKEVGNVLMEEYLLNLVESGLVSPDFAYEKANDKREFEQKLKAKGIHI